MAPTRLHDTVGFGGDGANLTKEGVETLQRLLEREDLQEPLARQILLEANALGPSNRRAAFVLAMVAAEVGIKQFAAGQRANSSEAWLISEMPSPPLPKLIANYLPYFTDRRTGGASEKPGRAVPQRLQSAFENAVKPRNQMVHKGLPPPGEAETSRLLAAVNDLLYLLDWFAGNAWAFRHLSNETRAAWPTEP